MSLVIRSSVPEDAPAIHRLILELLPALTVDPEGRGAEEFLRSVTEDALRAAIADPRFDYLSAVEGNALIAVIAMRDRSHLFHLFVAGAHQGRGLARRLWDEARERSRARSHDGPFTVNASLSAIPVYEAFGFRSTGPRVVKHGVAFVPMALEG